MASVAEVKAALDAANQKVAEAQQTLMAAKEHIEQAQSQALVAVDGSGHDSVTTGNAFLADAGAKVDETIQVLSAATESYGQYSAGL
jgi:hypothetical protein